MSKQTEQQVGGPWTGYHPLTAEDKKVFDEAMAGFVSVKYTPGTVATQLTLLGTNYRYKCTASIPPAEVVWEAIVEIFKPELPGAKPYITGIIRI